MKRLAPYVLLGFVAIFFWWGYLLAAQKVKKVATERLQRAEQVIEGKQNDGIWECRLQYPHDLIDRAKCYQRLMVRTDI